MQTPAKHLRATHTHSAVSDDTLRLLGRSDPGRAMGQIDATDQAILAMTLEDICAELLEHRRAHRLRRSRRHEFEAGHKPRARA
jgi:hypothetical protein